MTLMLLNLFKQVRVSQPECLNLLLSEAPLNMITLLHSANITEERNDLFFFIRDPEH